MKVGDLVKKLNPWEQYNPWMGFHAEPGLVVEVCTSGNMRVRWLWSKRLDWVVPRQLKKIE